MSSDKGWVGFDLDGTLAHSDEWAGPDHIGAPIAPMVEKVKAYLAAGIEVRILTARVWHDLSAARLADAAAAERAIKAWCVQHIGRELRTTCAKDYDMWALYDDRAVAVEKNTGRILGGEVRQ